MSVKTKNFIVSLLISLVYFLGILRFSTLANKYLKSEFVLIAANDRTKKTEALNKINKIYFFINSFPNILEYL